MLHACRAANIFAGGLRARRGGRERGCGVAPGDRKVDHDYSCLLRLRVGNNARRGCDVFNLFLEIVLHSSHHEPAVKACFVRSLCVGKQRQRC